MPVEEEFQGVVANRDWTGLLFSTWEDGTPMYDGNGIPLPNATQAELGVTREDFLVLAPRAHISVIIKLAARIVEKRNPDMTQERVDAIRARHLAANRPC